MRINVNNNDLYLLNIQTLYNDRSDAFIIVQHTNIKVYNYITHGKT